MFSLYKKHIVLLVFTLINPSYSFNNLNLFNRRAIIRNSFYLSHYDKLNNLKLYNSSSNKYYIYTSYDDNKNKDNIKNSNFLNEENEIIPNQENSYKKKQKNNIYFTGHLNEETCFGLNEALLNHKNQILLNNNYNDHINLFIQSPGGSLMPTLGLVDEIKNLEIPVHTYIRGYAASAATLLSIVGKKRYMYKHSVMMIHGLKFGGEMEVDSLLAVRDLNENTNLFMNIIKSLYLENSNLSLEELEEMFMHDKWFGSEEALKYGLIDEII